jgi:polar amino acid transport system permease protein
VALARTSEFKWLRFLALGYIKIFQGTPLLMQLFLAFFVPGIFGIDGRSLGRRRGGPVAARQRLPRRDLARLHRGRAARPVRGATLARPDLCAAMALIIIPQAFRIAIPPTIGFLVQLIKGTSLASIIGFVEMTRAAQIINNATFRPFTIFALVALVYFLICWPLSAYSKPWSKTPVASR